ncbi:MAG: hypothetical protein FJZ04_03490, partial [Candidatus Moranbacteria bacterium]|nr:hypothetical protein [Candidatus Moranbacteria bacterium]
MHSISHKDFNWIFIEEAKAEDISFIQAEFDLHPLIIGKLTTPLYRPQFSDHKDYLFLVLHYPIFGEDGRFREVGEIDILANEKFLVTVCSHQDSSLSRFFEQCQRNFEGSKKYFQKGPLFLILIIIAQVLNNYYVFLDRLAKETERIENNIFSGRESRILREISFLQRDILDVRRVIKPQLPVFRSFFEKEGIAEDNFLKVYAQEIVSTNVQIWNTLENYWETASALHGTNNTLLSYKLNKVIYILTAFSVC